MRTTLSASLHSIILLLALFYGTRDRPYRREHPSPVVLTVRLRPHASERRADTTVPRRRAGPPAKTFQALSPGPRSISHPLALEPVFAEDEFHPSEPALGSVSTRLPPPPIVVGKLAAITYSASVTSAAHIRTTGFDTAPIDVVPAAKPLEILFKPRPAYTDEARRLRIEGEVVLDVLFTASGEAHVQGVIQSLGHGLDESARESAAHIQFRPATRGGESIDQSAIVHIAFQLAY